MGFREQYTTAGKVSVISLDDKKTEFDKQIENQKIVISEEAFALCEVLTKLMEKL